MQNNPPLEMKNTAIKNNGFKLACKSQRDQDRENLIDLPAAKAQKVVESAQESSTRLHAFFHLNSTNTQQNLAPLTPGTSGQT